MATKSKKRGGLVDKLLRDLPERTRKRLAELETALLDSLGDDLEALVVFGSAVRGGFRPESSDVDLVVVLRDDSRKHLEAIGPALLLARNAARIEAMIVKGSELQHSADVFPLFYDDIRERSVVLVGKNPFESLTITDAHRRLRIEQELRELRIRSRRLLADATADERFLAAGIDRKLKQMRSPLYALLRLHGKKVSDGLEDVLRAASSLYDINVAPLLSAREKSEAAYDAVTALLDAAIADVDSLDKPE